MSDLELALETKATKLLLAALVTELQRVAPGTIDRLDTYMVELLSRPAVESLDRQSIVVARELLVGLRGR